MRTLPIVIGIALLAASSASAQQNNTPPPQVDENTGASTASNGGQIDVGFRDTIYGSNSDEARYQRYRDLRNGPFGENLRWERQSDHAGWDVRATHVGYRDQQYAANYNDYGKLKISFEWNQIPLFFSEDTRTAYTQPSSGVLRLDGLPQQVQSGAATSAIYNAQANPYDLRLKRSIADLRLTYLLRKNLGLNFALKNTQKSGAQPWGATFGFSDAVEVPVPVDTRTTDVGAAAEWTGDRGEMRVGYDGSFFRNNVTTLVWDNPLRSADSPTAGPSQGRMALWPNSDLNAGSVSGLYKLPKRSEATAYLSLGEWNQNQPLIPFTINSALPPISLDRQTAEAKARVTSTAFTFNARPTDRLWLNARVRTYDFDNRTPVFNVPVTVSYDTTEAAFAEGGTSPYSFSHKAVDLDASWTPQPFTAFRAAYTREVIDQTFRTFDTTTENTLRLSADASSVKWLTLRGVYEYARRLGSGLDEQTLDDIGEQVSLRQFDVSNRTSHRASAIVMVAPVASLSFNGTAFLGREQRPGTVFGLLHNNNTGGSIGFDYVPNDRVSAGASYDYERNTSLQRSRQANPGAQFNDPTRDWTTDGNDRSHTVNASADLLKLWPRTDLRFEYDFIRAQSAYIYGLAPNTTLPPVSQLPAVLNQRNRFTADAEYTLTRHVGMGLVYWIEKYTVNDFAFSPATLKTVAMPSFVALDYWYRPYTANTIWARLRVLW